MFWKINGAGFEELYSPMPTAHLLYELPPQEYLNASFAAKDLETRRGKTFTVFERRDDDRIIVSIYNTADMPRAAKLENLEISRGARPQYLP